MEGGQPLPSKLWGVYMIYILFFNIFLGGGVEMTAFLGGVGMTSGHLGEGGGVLYHVYKN